MAAALKVTGTLIVVTDAEGVQHYLHRGAELPDWVDKDHVKQLRDSGLAGQPKPAASPAKGRGRASAKKPDEDQGSNESTEGGGDADSGSSD